MQKGRFIIKKRLTMKTKTFPEIISIVLDFLHSKGIEDFIEIVSFPQIWASTALGWGGCMGGSALTTAWSIMVLDRNDSWWCFFNDRFAYRIPREMGDECRSNLSLVSTIEVLEGCDCHLSNSYKNIVKIATNHSTDNTTRTKIRKIGEMLVSEINKGYDFTDCSESELKRAVEGIKNRIGNRNDALFKDEDVDSILGVSR